MSSATFVLVAVGSNLAQGGMEPNQVVARTMAEFGPDVTCSPVYRTPAFPTGSGPDFANAVMRFSWPGTAAELMAHLHDIERAAERHRVHRWGARTLDLDLLAFGSEISPSEAVWAHWAGLPLAEQLRESPQELILPHPRLSDRAFVLVPMLDVAPDWHHPVTGLTAQEMLAAVPIQDRDAVVPWTDGLESPDKTGLSTGP